MADYPIDEQQLYLRTLKIASLNDEVRRSFNHTVGMYVTTRSFTAEPKAVQRILIKKIREFEDFDEANDPYHEHDTGIVTHLGRNAMFKIDYYDKNVEGGSPDPSDPTVTQRVMTVMLTHEY